MVHNFDICNTNDINDQRRKEENRSERKKERKQRNEFLITQKSKQNVLKLYECKKGNQK